MQQASLGIGKHPVAHGKIAGDGLRQKRQLDCTRLGYRAQARAVNRSDTAWDEVCLLNLELLLEELGPSQT
jgi:hypothetical protein